MANEYIPLGNHYWRIHGNPEGAGLMLAVDRGISCESHTQCVTVHTTNTPSLETVGKVVERRMEEIKKKIDSFVDFMTAYGWCKDGEFKETIGLLFKHNLLKSIAQEAEEEEWPTPKA